MGLFGFFKKKETKQRLLPEEIELQERVKKHDDILSAKNEAESRYKETGNLEEYLDFYRELTKDSSCFEIGGSWIFNYPETLIKEKLYDEAWGILNLIYIHMPQKRGRVSDLRYKILKTENKNHKDAIYHLMASTLFLFDGVVDKAKFAQDEKPKFLKKASPLAKKAGFTQQNIEYCYYLIECEAMNKKISDNRLDAAYKKFLKEIF